MSVVLQVLLLVVAIVVAVAGIGAALALRLSSRQQAARLRRRPSGAASAVVPESRMGKVVPLASARAAAQRQVQATEPAASPATPNPPLTPEPAHQAKLVALQALLALGDAQAERAAKSGRGHFADTQPAEDDPSTQFLDRLDPAQPVSLLNLDKLPARRGLKT
jgi:hypothetical protein